MPRKDKSIGKESRFVFVWGWGWEWDWPSMGTKDLKTEMFQNRNMVIAA